MFGIQPGVPESDIRKMYRSKSLLIHPDKTTNPRAPEAFDRLKVALEVLVDEKQRAQLDEAIADARMLTMRDKKLTKDDEEVKGPEFKKAWDEKVKWVLLENARERKRKYDAAMREQGRQQRKEEEEMAERKKRREHEEAWEKTRDARINSWREFSKGADAGKKKKKKVKTLG